MKIRKTKNGIKFISENTGNDNLAVVAIGQLLVKCFDKIPEEIYNNNGMVRIGNKYLNYCEIPFDIKEIEDNL